MNIRVTHWILMLKSLIKGSVDNFVLPGTMTGTEILWLYMIQWKRDMSALTFAMLYFVCAQFDFTLEERKPSHTPVVQEKAIE